MAGRSLPQQVRHHIVEHMIMVGCQAFRNPKSYLTDQIFLRRGKSGYQIRTVDSMRNRDIIAVL